MARYEGVRYGKVAFLSPLRSVAHAMKGIRKNVIRTLRRCNHGKGRLHDAVSCVGTERR
jgi:hypothetical protein